MLDYHLYISVVWKCVVLWHMVDDWLALVSYS